MTDVNKTNSHRISTPRDALALYAPAPAAMTGKMGIEVEMALYRAEGGKIAIPRAQDMQDLQVKLKAQGHDAQLEAAGVLEYASPPARVQDLALLCDKVAKDIKDFESAVKDAGFVRAPHCVLPTTTRHDAMENRVARERLNTALEALGEIWPEQSKLVPLLTTGVQVSFSPKDEEELFGMVRRAYALTPLLIAAMNSSSGFVENDPKRQHSHLRSQFYAAHGTSGGIARAFLRSENAQEFLQNHIESVWKAPMLFAYDEKGNTLKTRRTNVLTFEKLAAAGLDTQSNYELAESFLYHDVKVCNLRDEAGVTIGKRVEVRACDSGIDQPFHALLLTAALVPDGKTAQAFEALLKDYGFSGNPKRDANLLCASKEAAANHGGKYMDVAFGTGRLRDFAADVASLVAAHYADVGLDLHVARLCTLLQSGACDAQRFANTAPTLEKAKEALVANTRTIALKH